MSFLQSQDFFDRMSSIEHVMTDQQFLDWDWVCRDVASRIDRDDIEAWNKALRDGMADFGWSSSSFPEGAF